MKRLMKKSNYLIKYIATLAIFLICGNLFSPFGPTAQATIINVPGDQPTIQAAITAASNGDTINVAPGSYPENVTINKTLTMRGAQVGVDARGRVVGVPNPLFESVIDPVLGAPIELLGGSSSSVIDGFAMLGNVTGTNGVIQTLTAILSSVQLKNNYLKVTSTNGQALWFNRGITDVTIDQNELVGGTTSTQVIFLNGPQSFAGMYLTNNNVLGGGGTYGLFVDGNRNVGTSATPRSPLFQGNLFQGLVAGINAGSRSLQDVQMLENTFNNNTSLGFQGGPKNCNFARNTFTGNGLYGMSLTAFGSTDPLRGGQGTTIQNNFFSGNATSVGAFGDILLSNQTTGTQNSNLITNNSLVSVTAIYNNEPDGSTDTIHAECNWYGSSSPGAVSAKIFNIPGGIVDYIPYLTVGTDDSLGIPGFQPVPGSCDGPPCPDTIAPVFNSPTPCDSLISGSIGDSITFTVTAKDNFADSITLDVDSLPPGATMTPALPDSGNPVSSLFNWIPSASGFDTVSFIATDSCGNQTICIIRFEIVGPCPDTIAPVFNPPTPTCQDVIIIGDTGVAITFTVQAKDNFADSITLDVDSLPPGATMTPPLPTSGNPVSSVFTWTPTSYGFQQVTFTATDSCGNQTSCQIIFDVALPVELTSFTSLINNNQVTLKWSTATESNNSRFEIERAHGNSQEWNKVGTIQGNGNSTQPISYSFVNRGLNVGSYSYRLKQIDFNGNFTYHNLSNEVVIGVPTRFNLSQNYPNPFNPSTKIDYDLPYDSKVELKIFDISGREVAIIINEFRQAGYYTELFNATNLSSGIYFYRIKAGEFIQSKRMILVK